jgi:hypothetical protein
MCCSGRASLPSAFPLPLRGLGAAEHGVRLHGTRLCYIPVSSMSTRPGLLFS